MARSYIERQVKEAVSYTLTPFMGGLSCAKLRGHSLNRLPRLIFMISGGCYSYYPALQVREQKLTESK